MGDVTQYTLNRNDAQMEEHPNGAWVKHKELKAALAREAALREQLTQHAIAIRDMNVTEAALREELASNVMTIQELAGANDDLQQRLTAAEQRNAELVELLHETLPALALGASAFKSVKPIQIKVRAALKPTESGASALNPKIIGIERMPPMEYDEP